MLDELYGSVLAAAWPLVRDELQLSYAQVGLALAVPAVLGNLVEPAVGVLGDSPRRRAVLLAGGVALAAAVVATGLAAAYAVLLAALVLYYPASGAFVSLSQASLMDLDPTGQERNMARWTLAGSVAVVAGPLLVGAAAAVSVGWRPVMLAIGIAALALVWIARRLPLPRPETAPSLRRTLAAFRKREVWRWLAAIELGDLLGDVFAAFLALYLVDVAGADPARAALGLAVWSAAGLAGDALLLPLLARVDGLRYLRTSALVAVALYPAFLLVPGFAPKVALLALLGLLHAGWYAIPKARLYAALPGQSGAVVVVGSVGGFAAAIVPLALGVLGGTLGLGPTLWLLLLGPGAVLVLVPRTR